MLRLLGSVVWRTQRVLKCALLYSHIGAAAVEVAARSLTDEVEPTPRALPRMYDDLLALPFIPTSYLEWPPAQAQGTARETGGAGRNSHATAEAPAAAARSSRPLHSPHPAQSSLSTGGSAGFAASLLERGLAQGSVLEKGEISQLAGARNDGGARGASNGKGRFEFSLLRGGMHYVEGE